MAIVTVRTFTVADLLIEFKDTMIREARSFCPIVNKLTEMGDTWTVEDFETWIFAQPYAVEYVLDVLRTAGTHHPPDVAGDIQTNYANQLATYDWRKVRPGLEALLQRDDIVYDISAPAMRVLIGLIGANHPNPKMFVMKPVVHARIPADVDMTDWGCPDFPELEDIGQWCGGRTNCEQPADDGQHTQLTGDDSEQG